MLVSSRFVPLVEDYNVLYIRIGNIINSLRYEIPTCICVQYKLNVIWI